MPEESMKEDYMTKCMKDHTKEECEMMWQEQDSANAKSKDHATLVNELEMKKVEVDQLKKMLRESVNIVNALNAEKAAKDEAKKFDISIEIERDSDGKLKHAELMGKDLNELIIMKKAIDSARPRDFVSTAALLSEHDSKNTPKLTVGEWDPTTKKWKGGV